ncbi:MAG: Ultraviolet N-glycosylase/AP lyase [Elusimicrobia bacterium]|nr:Ultraviolet N-glycosylase/AP lyase [Elusimicrobiota bacterium]
MRTRFGNFISPANVNKVARILKKRYGDDRLDNKLNPLNELLFILLSITTTEPVYKRTYKSLRRAFPEYSDLAVAPIGKISKAIHEGGQYKQKAVVIRSIIRMLTKRFGKPTLAPLKKLPNEECERFLTSLSGVGKKVARCVMLYSLGRQVFPVDTHCRRVGHRLGWLPRRTSKKPRSVDDDLLQSRIPRELRFSLHVNMISLGREFCRSTRPDCFSCPLSEFCPKFF